MTAASPITRLVPGRRVRAVMSDKGGTRTLSSPYRLTGLYEYADWIPTAHLRAIAESIRECGDHRDNWGTFPCAPVVDGLIALADEVDASPVAGHDQADIGREHRDLLVSWQRRMEARSPLLAEAARIVDDLVVSRSVGQARAVLALLADADLLLPGVDAELRPVLARYAAIDQTEVTR
ncbi:hypothetical protein [Dactylosporangium sp. CA-139066]|uniref:hypothetical protein n=1 Tax=Dactylosporangium sp. CA-139066 TaxID=3239930 RepID=UPI003D8EAD78